MAEFLPRSKFESVGFGLLHLFPQHQEVGKKLPGVMEELCFLMSWVSRWVV